MLSILVRGGESSAGGLARLVDLASTPERRREVLLSAL
jgi:hypothetical protein